MKEEESQQAEDKLAGWSEIGSTKYQYDVELDLCCERHS